MNDTFCGYIHGTTKLPEYYITLQNYKTYKMQAKYTFSTNEGLIIDCNISYSAKSNIEIAINDFDEIEIPLNIQSNIKPSTYKSIKMLVDTGSNRTVLKKEIIEELGLNFHSDDNITGVTGQTNSSLYHLEFNVPSVMNKEKINIVVSDGLIGEHKHFDGLLGRDVLKFFTLIYNGKENSFTLEYNNSTN